MCAPPMSMLKFFIRLVFNKIRKPLSTYQPQSLQSWTSESFRDISLPVQKFSLSMRHRRSHVVNHLGPRSGAWSRRMMFGESVVRKIQVSLVNLFRDRSYHCASISCFGDVVSRTRLKTVMRKLLEENEKLFKNAVDV